MHIDAYLWFTLLAHGSSQLKASASDTRQQLYRDGLVSPYNSVRTNPHKNIKFVYKPNCIYMICNIIYMTYIYDFN